MATVSKQKSDLLEQFNETRTRTLNLVQTLEKDDFVVQTAPFMSPPKWHLGHVSWLFEIVMSKTSQNYEFYSEEFNEYLNSYYHQFGEPHDKNERGLATRPTVDQVFEYFHIITNNVSNILQNEVLNAIKIVTSYDYNKRIFNLVSDYNVDNFSKKIVKIVHSYIDYINRTVWYKY